MATPVVGREGAPVASTPAPRLSRRLLLGGMAALVAKAAQAAYPERPITMMHGFAPGGSADALARVLAPSLGSLLGQTVLVEPRPGAGGMVASGVISRALLAAGVPPERLVVVEIVPDMADHLRRVLPGANVIEGDAFDLGEALPAALHGKVGTAICGIPLVMLPLDQQRRFVDAVERVAPGKGFLLYTYCITSPLPYRRLGLSARREAWTPLNLPPASVWRYQPVG